jgi:hypothetical protein
LTAGASFLPFAPLIVFGNDTTPANVQIETDFADGGSINWDSDSNLAEASVSADINNLGIPGCGADAGQTLVDNEEWSNLLYDFRNAAGGSFDNLVPLSEVTSNIALTANLQDDWYSGLLNYHRLNEPHTDDDGDGLVDEDEKNQVDDDLDGLIDEDPSGATNIVPKVGEIVDISFQIFSCSHENIPLPGQTFVDKCVDKFKIVKEKDFYLNNGREVFDPSIEGQELLSLINVPSPETQFILRVSRINADNSANSNIDMNPNIPGTQKTRDFTGFTLHSDIVTHPVTLETAQAGFFHLGFDSSNLLGAGKYSFDILYDDGISPELRQAVDFNRVAGANTFKEKVDANTISGFHAELDTTFEAIFLEDAS